jgi:hypothetical protein
LKESLNLKSEKSVFTVEHEKWVQDKAKSITSLSGTGRLSSSNHAIMPAFVVQNKNLKTLAAAA